MLRRFFVVLVALLSVACGEPESADGDEGPPSFEMGNAFDDVYHLDENCDRLSSRVVREILQREVLPVIEHAKVDLPQDCPFHPSNDWLAPHEENKKYVRSTGWKCKYCSKQFRAEKWIDIHMGSRHADKLDKKARVCLARYCDVFQCRDHDLYKNPAKSTRAEERAARDARSKERREGLTRARAGKHCNENTMLRHKYLCLATFQRCLKPGVIDEGHDLLEYLSGTFCSALTCAPPAARGVSAGPRVLATSAKLASAAAKVTTGQRLYYIAMGFVVLLLAIFYIGMWVYKRDLSVNADLRRLDGKRRGEALMFWKKKKEKGY